MVLQCALMYQNTVSIVNQFSQKELTKSFFHGKVLSMDEKRPRFLRVQCMLFKTVTLSFEAIAQTSSRLVITRILAELLREADPDEARIISYLALGLLRPPFQSTQFGIAAKSMAKVLAELLGVTIEEVVKRAHELGDLGLVAATGSWHPSHELSVNTVYERLVELERISGVGSQEEKTRHLATLLQEVSPQSAQIIVRMVLGMLRLGFSDMTLIDAFSWMLVGDKSLRVGIEHAYNVCADIGLIAQKLRADGQNGLDEISIVVGIPIRPALAERLPNAQAIVQKLGACVAQPKLDGFRLQIHGKRANGKTELWFFSRNLVDMSAMFPDLVKVFEQLQEVESFIVEGEAVVYDAHTKRYLPFQQTVKRKRKYDIEQAVEDLPLHLFLFDILYCDGHSLLSQPHYLRRQVLIQIFGPPSQRRIVSVIEERSVSTTEELYDYFLENIKSGFEGIVVKRPDAPYRPGKRNFNWIKLKKGAESAVEDTIDAVILGYYYGRGKRSMFGIGAFLVGVYDKVKDRFETIAKVGTGLKDEDWRELKRRCDTRAVPEKPTNVVCSSELYPDVWVAPEMVCAVRADEITQSPLHTAGKTVHMPGFALRFPRFLGYRVDKSAQEATTVSEIKRLWEDQYIKTEQAKPSADSF